MQAHSLCTFFSLVLQPPWTVASSFSFTIIFTDGRTPWTSDQPVVRPLPNTEQHKHRINTYTYQTCHALSGIRTHDPSVQSDEESSCLRRLGYCDRRLCICVYMLCILVFRIGIDWTRRLDVNSNTHFLIILRLIVIYVPFYLNF
jgi:hypothetical protein